MPRNLTPYLFAAVAIAAASPGLAQDTLGDTVVPPTEGEQPTHSSGPSGFIGVGGAVVPKFDGSDKYKLSPLVVGNIDWQGVELQLRGASARLDLTGPSKFQFGPAIGMRSKRNNKDADGPMSLLPDIKTAIEAGGFVSYRFGGNARGEGAITFDLTALKGVSNGYDGFLATAQLSYAALRSRTLSLDVDASTTFGDKKYMRTYFGITPEQAAISGLGQYRPDAGLRNIGTGVTANYRLTKRWGLIVRVGGNYYVGDAKDSPVVKEGAKFQGTGALGISYRF